MKRIFVLTTIITLTQSIHAMEQIGGAIQFIADNIIGNTKEQQRILRPHSIAFLNKNNSLPAAQRTKDGLVLDLKNLNLQYLDGIELLSKELVALDLSGNNFQTLDLSVFKRLTNLQVLVLNNCRIRFVAEGGDLSCCKKLENLSLIGNEITSLQSGWLKAPIKSLFLDENKLKNLSRECFDIASLEVVSLNNNDLTEQDMQMLHSLPIKTITTDDQGAIIDENRFLTSMMQ